MTDLINGVSLRDQLNLMQVNRYPICFTNKLQTVAEHTYGVLVISLRLAALVPAVDVGAVLAYALLHDVDESDTGDIPSPFKRRLRAECPQVTEVLDRPANVPEEVKNIVKLADYVEAILFLKEYGGSLRANSVLADVMNNFLLFTRALKGGPLHICCLEARKMVEGW